MNLAELINAVLPLTGAEYESDITRHINKALLDLVKESTRTTRQSVVTAFDGKADLPPDCLLVKNVYYNGYELRRYHNNDLPNITGTAKYWVKDGDKIALIPNPGIGKTAQVAYTARPALLVNPDDTPSISDADDYLIAYATWKTRVESLGAVDDTTNYWREIALHEYREWIDLDKKQESRPHRVIYRPWV